MKRILGLSVLFSVLVWLIPSNGFSEELNIGVLANRGALQASKEWKATAEYLSSKTGQTFTIVPLEYDQLPQWLKEKKIQFVIANSAMYAELNKTFGINAIATQVASSGGQQLDKFGSTILVKQDSPVQKLSDLKGKSFACASHSAFGGWLMTVRLMIENGMDPNSSLSGLRELKTHDNVVYAVLNGAVDAGSVRTGTIEKMAQEGKIKLADFRIINQISDGFPLLHSTQLYPEYPIAATRDVPVDLRHQVAKHLIALAPGDHAAVDARIAGWKEPLEYGSVVECLTQIGYGAFKDQARSASTPAAKVKAEVTAVSDTEDPSKNQAHTTKGRAVNK